MFNHPVPKGNATLRFHLTSSRMVIVKSNTGKNIGESKESLYIAGSTTIEISIMVLQKMKNGSSI
jgi:hypothetical protein